MTCNLAAGGRGGAGACVWKIVLATAAGQNSRVGQTHGTDNASWLRIRQQQQEGHPLWDAKWEDPEEMREGTHYGAEVFRTAEDIKEVAKCVSGSDRENCLHPSIHPGCTLVPTKHP